MELKKHTLFIPQALLLLSIILTQSCEKVNQSGEELGPPWLIYNTANSPLLSNQINFIFVDPEGKVWFATDAGASAMASKSWFSIRDQLSYWVYRSGEPPRLESQVTSVTAGKHGTLWLGLRGGGVARYAPTSPTTTWLRYAQPEIVYDVITGITSEPLIGEIWVTTLLGVSRFTPSSSDPDQGVWSTYTLGNTPELSSNQVRVVALNPNDNSVWFGTQTGTLASASYDIGVRWRSYTPPDVTYPIISICFDASNVGWFGTSQGVWSLDVKGGTWKHYTTESTNGELPQGAVNAVMTDLRTTRWFGTDAGLRRLSDTTWTSFTRTNSPLPSDTVTALAYDRKGNLWIGTSNGVAEFNEGGIRF